MIDKERILIGEFYEAYSKIRGEEQHCIVEVLEKRKNFFLCKVYESSDPPEVILFHRFLMNYEDITGLF
jgi:hypothetical protein